MKVDYRIKERKINETTTKIDKNKMTKERLTILKVVVFLPGSGTLFLNSFT